MKPFFRPITEKIVGGHMHRSGWPYVLDCLKPLFSDSGKIIFDDFLEKTICNQREKLDRYVHTEPWVGICHYPYDTPNWYETEHLRNLPSHDSWSQSLSNMKLCITLGENLADWVRKHWAVPCISLRHPTEIPDTKWTKENFLNNEEPLFLQVGWYLRNTHAIFQADVPSFISKGWLRSRRNIAEINHTKCAIHFQPKRVKRGTVHEIEPVNNDAYDLLLSKNVVFIELITSVANNTIIECIARNTPIFVNRLPGPEYYLGKEYPLFYDNLQDLSRLITKDNIIAAHEYLLNIDKSWLRGEYFRNKLLNECIKHVPEMIDENENYNG